MRNMKAILAVALIALVLACFSDSHAGKAGLRGKWVRRLRSRAEPLWDQAICHLSFRGQKRGPFKECFVIGNRPSEFI
jgi:hypothetical protein